MTKPGKFIKYGIFGGLLETLYIFLLITLINLVTSNFPKENPSLLFLSPILFLIVFVFSAAISGLLVLGYPAYLLFFEKKIKEGIITIVSSLVILLIAGIAIFSLIACALK